MICVQIVYGPNLYAEVLARVLEQTGAIEIVGAPSAKVDVIVFPLDDEGRPRIDLLPQPLPNAKLIAFSAQGDRGLMRLPDADEWVEARPFGLDQLVREVLTDHNTRAFNLPQTG